MLYIYVLQVHFMCSVWISDCDICIFVDFIDICSLLNSLVFYVGLYQSIYTIPSHVEFLTCQVILDSFLLSLC